MAMLKLCFCCRYHGMYYGKDEAVTARSKTGADGSTNVVTKGICGKACHKTYKKGLVMFSPSFAAGNLLHKSCHLFILIHANMFLIIGGCDKTILIHANITS